MKHFLYIFSITFVLSSLLIPISVLAQDNSVLFPASSRVRAVDAPQLDITGTLTLEVWIYQAAKVDDWPVIIQKSLDNLVFPWDVYSLRLDNGLEGQQLAHFQIANGNQNADVFTPNFPIPLFQWTHLAATYTGDTMRIYINGVLRGQAPASISIGTSNGALSIGRTWLSASNIFRGFIDEVRVWNVARTKTQIQAAMNQQLATNDRAGLAAYYKFNEAPNATVLYDSSGYGNNANLINSAQIATFAPTMPVGSPQISFNPISLNLGNVEQGENTPVQLNVSNAGTGMLVGYVKTGGTNIALAGTYLFYVGQGGNYSFPITVRTLVAGPTSDNITVTNNTGTTKQLPFLAFSIAVNRLDANNIGMWVMRNGQFARNPLTYNAGLEWPKGSGKTSVYSSGVWIGAMVNGGARTAAATYASGFQAGPIMNGVPADPKITKYRVYKINAGDNAGTNLDYAQWPTDLGAPTNPDGSPQLIGDQTLWTVYNDADTIAYNNISTSQPLGAEVQQTTFAFHDPNSPLDNMVFVHFKVINKSLNTWQNAYLGLWADPDLGNYADDFVASDSARGMGIFYNADNYDDVEINNGYGTPPPALAYAFLQQGGSAPLNSFSFYTGADTVNGDPSTPVQAYNYLRGLRRNGTPYVNPTNGQITRYALSGDPVTGSGWVDSGPGDRRFLMTTGPFTLAPGESREIFGAIMMAIGASNLNSVEVLRQTYDVAHVIFQSGLVNAPQLLRVVDVPNDQGGKVLLTWRASTLDHDVRILPNYSVWRAVPWGMSQPGAAARFQDVTAEFSGPALVLSSVSGQPLAWEWVTNQPALRLPYYAFAAPTLNDSTSQAIAKHYFMVVAHTADPNIFFQSNVDSGYSKDNLPPGAPASVTAQLSGGTVTLQWQQNSDPDVGRYLIYRSASPSIDPNLTTAIGSTASTSFVDQNTPTDGTVYYVVRAQDVHENYGPKSNEVAVVVTGIEGESAGIPTHFALYQNHPNPFNPSTMIRFALPESRHVTLTVFDLLGQKVALLADDQLPAGYHTREWSPANLPSGIYLYRLQVGTFVETKKLVMMR